MSSVTDANMIAEATGRKAVLVESFTSDKDFEAIHAAEEFLTSKGYTIGGMCSDEPIAAARGLEYIAKWRNISQKEWPKVEAVIVSENMRNGPRVFIYRFER